MVSLRLLLFALAGVALADSRPNVVFIVVDDLGWDDVGFRSQQIETPTIDTLASRGRVLQSYYVQDVCSPSRATFMTGRYAMHHSIVDWIPPASPYGLPLNETTMAEKFKSAGYATHASGKWHLGFYKPEFTPTFRGFDSFLGFYSGGEDYFTHMAGDAYDFRRDSSPRCGHNCSQVNSEDQGTYSTFAFTREAVRVVDEHPFDEQPLFLYLAYQGVHAPAQVPASYEKKYEKSITDAKRRTFAGMLSAVDEGIANVTDALQRKGALDNTIIVFTSDNGGPTLGGDAVGSRNHPLRGGKHSVWEGGVRATSFIVGPGIPRGNDYFPLMHGADWLPTLGGFAGYDLKGTLPLDGVSHHDTLIGKSATPPRNGITIGNSTNLCSWKVGDARRVKYEAESGWTGAAVGCGFSIRDGDLKLISGYGGNPDDWCNTTASGRVCESHVNFSTSCPDGFCVFDVSADPFEYHEISQSIGEKRLNELKQKLASTLESYTEYKIDESCPKAKFVVDPKVGKAWAPWC